LIRSRSKKQPDQYATETLPVQSEESKWGDDQPMRHNTIGILGTCLGMLATARFLLAVHFPMKPTTKDETMDAKTTIGELRRAVHQFTSERDWDAYHTPKNLAMSIAIETAELMEHFQWLTIEESKMLIHNDSARAEIADELADILIYALSFSNSTGIDISDAISRKLDRNQTRFPVDVVRSKLGNTDQEI
jgi:NTP pyrophosphatase (non-canonical NTP hydrolase)